MNIWSELRYEEPELLVENDDPPTADVMNKVGKNKDVELEQLIEVSIKKSADEVLIVLNPSPLEIGLLHHFPTCLLEKY